MLIVVAKTTILDHRSYGANDIREYYNDGTTDHWENISGGAFANENDELVVPFRFYYSFFNDSNITAATFIFHKAAAKPPRIARPMQPRVQH